MQPAVNTEQMHKIYEPSPSVHSTSSDHTGSTRGQKVGRAQVNIQQSIQDSIAAPSHSKHECTQLRQIKIFTKFNCQYLAILYMAAKRKKRKSTFNVKAWECVAAEWAKFYNPNNQIIGWTGWNYNMQRTNSKVSVFPTLDGEKEARRLAVPNFGIIPYTGRKYRPTNWKHWFSRVLAASPFQSHNL